MITKERMRSGKIQTRMTRSGLIVYDRESATTIRFNREETCNIIKKKVLFNKLDDFCEIVHLEISDTCNMKCPYCYVREKDWNELNLDEWKHIIDSLASYGVFQVTFGGGEPTLYPHIRELADYVVSKGLNLGMTTNGITLSEFDPEWLSKKFRQINISWHQNYDVVENALNILYRENIRSGINYCFSREMEKDNEDVKYLAKFYDSEVLYLAYKAVIGDKENLIAPEGVYKVAKQTASEKIKTAVDGPCVGMCMMKIKFADINSLGEVFPCSFIRKSMGSILKDDFSEIWKRRGVQEPCPYIDFKEEVRKHGK